MAMLTAFSQPGYAGAVSAGMADVDSKCGQQICSIIQCPGGQFSWVFQMSAHAQKAVCKGQDLHPAFPFLCLLPIEEHSHSALLQGSKQCHQGQPKEYEP